MDATKRAFRTFIQGMVGTLALLGLPVLQNLVQAVAGGGDVVIDVDVWQSIGIAVVAGGVIALIAFAQNEFEDKTGKNLLPK